MIKNKMFKNFLFQKQEHKIDNFLKFFKRKDTFL